MQDSCYSDDLGLGFVDVGRGFCNYYDSGSDFDDFGWVSCDSCDSG